MLKTLLRKIQQRFCRHRTHVYEYYLRGQKSAEWLECPKCGKDITPVNYKWQFQPRHVPPNDHGFGMKFYKELR